MKIAVVIPTYYRSDGKTPFYLRRAIQSILDQKHTNWKIFLIGDRFENAEEIEPIIKMVPEGKILFNNLDFAAERDCNYPKEMLWKYGGVNATNTGISQAKEEGYDWIAHLDHDDVWNINHLFEINKVIESDLDPVWICTVAQYKNPQTYLPLHITHKDIVRFMPKAEQLIRSSVCMNFKILPLRYTDMYALPFTPKKYIPSDANLWEDCARIIEMYSLNSFCINKCTVVHLEEGFELNK